MVVDIGLKKYLRNYPSEIFFLFYFHQTNTSWKANEEIFWNSKVLWNCMDIFKDIVHFCLSNVCEDLMQRFKTKIAFELGFYRSFVLFISYGGISMIKLCQAEVSVRKYFNLRHVFGDRTNFECEFRMT